MHQQMTNLRMQSKLRSGDAIDVSGCERTPEGDYVLKEFVEDKDYCNAKTEQWMWSIGRELATGRIIASESNKLYQNPAYECLWLR